MNRDQLEQQCFLIKGETFRADDARFQEALASVYGSAQRPRCLCVDRGVEMYTAKHRRYVVKRMPDSGNRHHPSCPSFEPQRSQSGLGALLGESVIERSAEEVELRVGFPLARWLERASARQGLGRPKRVSDTRRRMSLRALMHFLFERAGFNRWYPAMAGKRHQGVVHKYLTAAAHDIWINGVRLSERLYVPEAFSHERQGEIALRRRDQLAVLHLPQDERQRMALVLGEFKGPESLSRRVWIKHMPDCPLLVEAKTWARLERCLGALLEARDAASKTKVRIVVCALVFANRDHAYQIEKASLMLATETWIPIEEMYEVDLIQALTAASRRFMKPLRYDAASAAAFPNVLLLDTGGVPTPLHVLSPSMEPKERAVKEREIRGGNAGQWVWHTERAMPRLPPIVGYQCAHATTRDQKTGEGSERT